MGQCRRKYVSLELFSDNDQHSGHHHANRPTAPEAKNLGLAGVAIHLMGDAVNS